MANGQKMRQKAWRMFAAEYGNAREERRGLEEFSPTFILTPLGGMVNRLYFVGVLMDKENKGTPEEPLWNAKVYDQSGNFFLSAGSYQQEAADAIAEIEPPAIVAVVGKVRSFVNQEGSFFVSVRPDHIREVSQKERSYWIYNAAKDLLERLNQLDKAADASELTPLGLREVGVAESHIEGILAAHEAYGFVDTSVYRSVAADSLRYVMADLRGEAIDIMSGDDSSHVAPSPGLDEGGYGDSPDTGAGIKVETMDATSDNVDSGWGDEGPDEDDPYADMDDDGSFSDVGIYQPPAEEKPAEEPQEEAASEPAQEETPTPAADDPPTSPVLTDDDALEYEDLVVSIIKDLREDGRAAPLHKVVEVMLEKGISEDQLDEVFEELLDNGVIYKPSDDMVNVI